MLFRIGFASVLASVALIAPASAGEISVRVHRSDDTLLRIGPYSFAGGKTLNLTVGIGSSAFRSPNDPSNVLWTLGDRGPNIECKDMKAIAGVELTCGEVKHGRVYPTPSYAPSIYRVLLPDDGSFRVTDVITLKDRDGRPLNGLPNPLRTASTETPLDGTEGDFAGAPYETKGSLPAIIAKRASNRGIEGIAISPDERFLYFIVQNPLANPDNAAYEKARNTRLFKLERGTMRVVGEYVYTLDDPQSFRRDPSTKQNAPRISELMALSGDRLVVDERTEKTTKLYEIELAGATNISGSRWDDAATRPTLEQTELAAAEIAPVRKTLRLDTADHPEIAGKTEGMALLGDGALALINDDDFGISGGHTEIAVVRGTGIKR